jgi:hypothetical protein
VGRSATLSVLGRDEQLGSWQVGAHTACCHEPALVPARAFSAAVTRLRADASCVAAAGQSHVRRCSLSARCWLLHQPSASWQQQVLSKMKFATGTGEAATGLQVRVGSARAACLGRQLGAGRWQLGGINEDHRVHSTAQQAKGKLHGKCGEFPFSRAQVAWAGNHTLASASEKVRPDPGRHACVPVCVSSGLFIDKAPACSATARLHACTSSLSLNPTFRSSILGCLLHTKQWCAGTAPSFPYVSPPLPP